MPNHQSIEVDPNASTGTLQPPTDPDPAQQPDEDAGEGEAAPAPPLPPLKGIFSCEKLRRGVRRGGVVGWECSWCGGFFNGEHATRALKHVMKASLQAGVRPCTGAIPAEYANR